MNFLLRNQFLVIFFVFFVLDSVLFVSGLVAVPFFSGGVSVFLRSNALFSQSLMLAEVSILAVFAYTTYMTPVRSLKKEIALFLTGSKNGAELQTEHLNPDIRFIISFFNKSLEILKSFKEEFQT